MSERIPDPEIYGSDRLERGLPPFAALRAFNATFRLGGVRKAAESLGIHHAVVSRQLKHLEDWIGVPLLIRTHNRLSLTEEGKQFHNRISGAIMEIALATRDLVGGGQDRSIRLCCMAGVAIQWLSGQIIDFQQAHPQFPVHVWPNDVPANLQAHEADANLHFYRDSDADRLANPGIRSQEIVRPRVVLVASPEFVQRWPKIETVDQLLTLPLLHGSSREGWRVWLLTQGVRVPDEIAGTMCWHVHMAIAAAKLGQGVMLASRFIVERDLRQGQLVQMEVPGVSDAPYGAYIFSAREDRWSQPPIKALRQFLTAEMRRTENIVLGA